MTSVPLTTAHDPRFKEPIQNFVIKKNINIALCKSQTKFFLGLTCESTGKEFCFCYLDATPSHLKKNAISPKVNY